MKKDNYQIIGGAIVVFLILIWKFPTFAAILALALSVSYAIKIVQINKQRKENPDQKISYVTNIGNKKNELILDVRKAFAISVIILAISASLGIKSKNKVETTKDPEIQWAERMNGSNTEVIAKMTYIIVPEKEVTDDYIKEWYKKVQDLDSTYDIIIYEETKNDNPCKGVYASGKLVLKDTNLEKEDDGSYSTIETAGEKTINIE
ncbi:hypothetical protein [uncultured Anaerococcus sp.]|uniref:hypothetical protein n=1 Tax=uncultured Anaerococcus sp. TaxID=293428 RepID=UPI0025EAF645|nr:hypothetical protein [uncultured Anaerococcus sp.]